MKGTLIAASLTLMVLVTSTVSNAQSKNSAPEPQPKALPASEQKTVEQKTIEQKVGAMQKLPGFFTCYWDAREGKLWLQIDKWNTPFLYYESLPNGSRLQ